MNISLPRWLHLSEDRIFLALTVLIGVISALSAVLFTLAIKRTTFLLFGISPSILRLILVPTLVSLCTGFLIKRFFPEAAGSGVPQTEAAFHVQQGYIPARVAFGKFLTGALCIGSGHSMVGKVLPYKSVPGWAPRSDVGSGFRPGAFRAWSRLQLQQRCRPRSTLLSRRCFLRWKKSSVT